MLYYIPPKQKIGSGASANNITAIKYTNNLKEAHTTMPSVRNFQPWNRFTYMLRAGKYHKTINKRTCSHKTYSLTIWKQANATRLSARGPVNMKQVRLLPESRQMPQDHQQDDLQAWNRFTYSLRGGKCHNAIGRGFSAWNRFTYFLRADKCHKTISKRTCNHETGSLTYWEQENATRPSTRGPAAMKQVYLLS